MVSFWKHFTPRSTAKTLGLCLALILVGGLCEPLLAAMSPTDVELEVLDLINEERQKNGIHALSWNDQLFEAAALHSEDMAESDYFSHTSLGGSSFIDRITAAGYSYSAASENIGAGQTDAQAIFDSWMNSQGHRENMLSASYCEAGVGYASGTNSQYTHYWTLDLGKQAGVSECAEIETDTESDTETQTDTDTETESDTETDTDTYTESDMETETDTDTESDTETQTDTYTESDTETEADTYTESDMETETDTDTESDTETQTDTYTESDTDTGANQAPIADVGKYQLVEPNSQVTLDGSNSSDPDGDPITYSWQQVSGPTVELDDSTSATPTFVAPTMENESTDEYGDVPEDSDDEQYSEDEQSIEETEDRKERFHYRRRSGKAISYLRAFKGGKGIRCARGFKSRKNVLTFDLVVSDGELDSEPAKTRVFVHSSSLSWWIHKRPFHHR
ncbi:MAG: CAP domain-containing protein [Desulfobacteraceae bacterium]|jgi:hypothetical protein